MIPPFLAERIRQPGHAADLHLDQHGIVHRVLKLQFKRSRVRSPAVRGELACLRKVESKFPGIPKLKYQVVDLRHGSATAEVRPVHNYTDAPDGPKVLRLFSDTAQRIQQGKAVDNRFSSSDLLPFRNLADPLRAGVSEIKISKTTITGDYNVNIEKLLGATRRSVGSVRGVIEKLNVHNKSEFTLFPLIGNRVLCSFPDQLYSQVLNAVKKHVTVYGKVAYLQGHDFPDRADIESIETHPPNEKLPKFSDMRGKGRVKLRAKTSAEYVKALRDD